MACVGHGRRFRNLPNSQRNTLLESLLTQEPEAAFQLAGAAPSGYSGLARQRRVAQPSPVMRLFGHPAVDEAWSTALEHKRPNLDLDSPDTLRALDNYANAFDEVSPEAPAKSVKKDVLDLRSRVLGPEHPETLRALNDYGSTLSDEPGGDSDEPQGDSAMVRMLEHSRKALQKRCELEAAADIAMMKDILHLKLEKIGAEHPETLTSLVNYADTLAQCGKLGEAARMKRQVLDIRRQRLGADHPDTLKALNSYADTLGELGRHTEAEPLRRQAHLLTRLALGPEHADTVKALSHHADTLAKLGRHTEAEPLLKEVLQLTKKKFGAEHPDTIRASKMYASTLEALGLETESPPVKTQNYKFSPEIMSFMDDYSDTISALSKQSAHA